MSSAGTKTIVTQLVVDASGAKTGVDQYEAALDRARQAANDAGTANTSFDATVRKWTQSLSATDPVLRAQVQQQQAVQRQMELNTRVVQLGIATQQAADAQLEKVKDQYQGYIERAKEAGEAQTAMGRAAEYLTGILEPLISLFAASRIAEFAKSLFENAAQLNDLATQAGVTVEAFQAYRNVMEQSGIAGDQAGQLIAKLTHTLGEAQTQSGASRDALNQLGIGYTDVAAGAEAALPKIATALLGVQDATQRARLENDLFGRSGQQLESALRELSDPTADIIEKGKALGVVLGHDVTDAANLADRQLSQAWDHMKVSGTPAVVALTGALAALAEQAAKVPTNILGFDPLGVQDLQKQALERDAQQNAPFSGPRVPNLALDNYNATDVPVAKSAYSSTELDQYIAKQKLSASIAGQGPVQQAQTNALIEAANTKLSSGAGLSADQLANFRNSDGTMRKFVTSTQEAVDVLGQATAQEVKGYAATIARGDAWKKVKETFDGYLASLDQEAIAAGKSAAERQTEADVIKGAQTLQKQQGVDAKDLVQSYAAAAGYLQKQSDLHGVNYEAQIRERDAAKITAATDADISDQLTLAGVALSANRDTRDLALQIAQKELQNGKALTDQEKERLALAQKINDAARLKDYVQDLRDEASLAGLSADERERQEAVLQAMRLTHGQLTDAQKDEISGIVAARQESERWQSVVSGIADGFQNFFENILTKGKGSFSSLWQSIQAQFAQMLAWMASQALIQPIIVPLVAGIMGSGGGLSSLLGGSGGGLSGMGALGALGSAGSAYSLISSGANTSGLMDSLGLGSVFNTAGGWFNGLGSALGFATPGVSAALPSFAVSTGFGGSMTVAPGLVSSPIGTTTGGLFGSTTFGSFLGGAGLGSLASTLIFGNKNDAGLGGMGGAALGAALGSIIPGVGTIIGGLAGGLLGGGLGSITGSSNQGAIANFTNGGAGSYLFKQGGGNNGQASLQATGTISDAISTLQQAGVSISLGNITGLSIGSDKSYVYDSAGGKQKLAGGDTQAVVNAILERILPSATGNTPEAQAVLAQFQANGGINAQNLSQLETALGSAKNFADSLANLKASDQTLSDAGQKLAAINSQYQQLLTQAQQYGLDTTTLNAARDSAITDLLDGYLGQLQAIGQAANDNNQAASQWQQAADSIATAEANATEAANALGSGLDQVQQAAGAARAALAGNFNDQISAAILQITNPQLAAYNQLMATQAQRLKDAAAAGADLGLVNELDSLETDAFNASQGLSALGDTVNSLTDAANTASKSAQDAVNGWQSASDALSKASTALSLSNPALSPVDKYNADQAQFQSLLSAARGGDFQAASDAASFASTFVQDSFAYNGSTAAFGGDLTYVQNSLRDLATFSAGQQSVAQRQLDVMTQAVSSLQDISKKIGDQTNQNSRALGDLADQVDELASEIRQANIQARAA